MEEFKPNLIGLSILEYTYPIAKGFLKEAYSQNIPIIAGGFHPTFYPEVVIKEDCIDILCIGERENALLSLCKAMAANKNYASIPNLWIKRPNGEIIKNQIGPLVPESFFKLSNSPGSSEQSSTTMTSWVFSSGSTDLNRPSKSLLRP